ncbi:signal peptidase II [Actinacidiphila rubida]|uniref:Lipoprotein signal peptidase n=1 Tax=Actinacidiphila rubida TaxID=310780 RepID=A0A1H8IM02_9ACTN|nr:signal peptidase II [Actinacidiphila rubida]SEN69026.1 signal peptidase II [Actinacidiphila rubida]
MTEAERTITTPDTPDEAPDTTAEAAASGAPTADSAADPTVGPAAGSAADPAADPDAARRRSRRVAVLIAVAALAYLLDLLSKLWVVHSLEDHDPIRVLGHYLQLDATRNAGAAFGMGQGMTIVFTLIAVGVIAVIVRLSRRLYSTPWAIALGLLLGGAFGNLTDRVFRAPGGFQGRVVDFIAPEHFAVFNLADSAICCGGALIVLLSFRGVDPDGSRHED